MSEQSFFDESTEQSQVKAAIVAKYFWAWAKVIMPRASSKIAYVDMFAGPGRYKDGTKSTPVLILERAIADSRMKEMLVTLFNDVDSNNSRSLQKAINAVEGIETLKYKPNVYSEEVGDNIVELIEEQSLVPTLFFVDPWGYKGLSLRLINSVLKNWGCDCIFFFNYNRINMGLNNEIVKTHMDALFGEVRADALRADLEPLSPERRELAIVEAIGEALKEMGGKYVLPFRFRKSSGPRTSHHLIFVSKNVLGYEIMKNIMARESSCSEQGVPTFEYNPAVRSQGLLFELSRPLDDLGDMLLEAFAGRSMTMEEVYKQHHVGTRFIKSNYKSILAKYEESGLIVTNAGERKRRKKSFPDWLRVTFPPQS